MLGDHVYCVQLGETVVLGCHLGDVRMAERDERLLVPVRVAHNASSRTRDWTL